MLIMIIIIIIITIITVIVIVITNVPFSGIDWFSLWVSSLV